MVGGGDTRPGGPTSLWEVGGGIGVLSAVQIKEVLEFCSVLTLPVRHLAALYLWEVQIFQLEGQGPRAAGEGGLSGLPAHWPQPKPQPKPKPDSHSRPSPAPSYPMRHSSSLQPPPPRKDPAWPLLGHLVGITG